jgi:hypothetical protein
VRHRIGGSWLITQDIPYHVNFVLWMQRRTASPGAYPDVLWQKWLERVVTNDAVGVEAICDLAPDPERGSSALQDWPAFVTEFNAVRRGIAERLHQEVVKARVQELMANSHQRFTLLHTFHPGDLCLRFGKTWVLGEGFLDAGRMRELVARIRSGG